MEEKVSFCRFCGVMCGIRVEVDQDTVVGVRGDGDHVLTHGYTCPKGRSLGAFHHHPLRLNHPQLRIEGKHEQVTWQESLDDLARTMDRVVSREGPDAIGIYLGTPALVDSTNIGRTFMQKLGSRSVYATTTVDLPAMPLVAELLAGNPYIGPQPDLNAAMTILIGWNPVVSHGHAFFMPSPRSVLKGWAQRGELWVVDPRRTETASLATHHVAPRPGSDYAVLGFLIRELLRDGADWEFIENFTSGIDQLADVVAQFTSDHVAEVTGVSVAVLDDLLASVRRAGRIAIHTGTGVTFNRSANVTVWFAWALGAVTGSLDRQGGIYFNPGYAMQIDKFGWGPREHSAPGAASRPELPGRLGELPCAVLSDEIESGNLRVLLVTGGNPVIALPDTERLISAFGRLEALAVADVITTGTTEHATHVFPAVGQLERADIPLLDVLTTTPFSQYTPAVMKPVAERRPSWWILAQLATRLGFDILPGGLSPDECTDEDVIAATLAATGRSLDEIRQHKHGIVGERRFGWVDKWLPDGRWQLAPEKLVSQAASVIPPDRDGLILITGRQLSKINSQLADDLSVRNRKDTAGVRLNPGDAQGLDISHEQLVTVASKNGSVRIPALVDAAVPSGVVMIPSGYENYNVGRLTSATEGVDPLTGMIEQSGIAVTVRPEGGND
ncbi:MAG TPA: molybdopterin-dependent oxidoreductase [Jatrophihabitans sp.]|jgi:anaerobic selenocysteine-containing dehydrogenase